MKEWGISAKRRAVFALSVLSLNLHGYHPMGEADRWLESRNGQRHSANPDLFYFSPEEFARGNSRRLDALAGTITRSRPDVVLLQEVGAGGPGVAKNCEEFHAASAGDDWRLNSALRLTRRLQGYELALACRGNRGWWTTPDTFRHSRVVRREGAAGFTTVFDFDANPYPDGLIVEGFATLVRAPLKIIDARRWELDVPQDDGKRIAQAVVISRPGEGWFVAVNIHAGHNGLAHFEQAVAVRENLAELIRRASYPGKYLGSFIAGDFNQGVHQTATAAWDLVAPGFYDYLTPSFDARMGELRRALGSLAGSGPDARERVEKVLVRLRGLVQSWEKQPPASHSLRMTEVFEAAKRLGKCQPLASLDGSCGRGGRIDLFYADPFVKLANAFIAFSANSWSSLQFLSDHPGLWVEINQ